MQFAKLGLVLSLAPSVTGCGCYTWRPLQEAAMDKFPHMGRVRLDTNRGSFELRRAKATRAGVVGEWDGPDGRRLMEVPRAEIRGGDVYEPDFQQRNKVIISLSVGLGIALNALFIGFAVAGTRPAPTGNYIW